MTPLLAALDALGAAACCLVSHRVVDWASLTFAGKRHTLEYLFTGPQQLADGERFIAGLDGTAFELPGWLLADAHVAEVWHDAPSQTLRVRAEVLLLEDS